MTWSLVKSGTSIFQTLKFWKITNTAELYTGEICIYVVYITETIIMQRITLCSREADMQKCWCWSIWSLGPSLGGSEG